MEFFVRLLDRIMSLRLNPYKAHGLAILIVGVALGLQQVLRPWVNGTMPFATLFPAILLSALVGGTAVGITAWLLGGLASWYLFLSNYPGLSTSELVSLSTYSGTALILLVVAHALRTTTVRYKALVTTSAVLVWRAAGNGQIEEIIGWTEFTGNTEPTYKGYGWVDAVHPDDREPVLEIWKQAQTNKEPVRVEMRFLNKVTGESRWADVRGVPIKRADGTVQEWFGTAVDIDANQKAELQRRKIETALRKSEEHLRLFLESNIIGILHSDVQGHVYKANSEFLRIIGYTYEDMKAGLIPWAELTPPKWQPLDTDRIAETLERGACTHYEKEFVRKDGTRVPVLIGYILLDAESQRVLAFVLDLTEQKRAVAALRESEARFRIIADSAPVPIWISSTEGGIEFCNKASLVTYGHPLEDIMGWNWVRFLHPDDRDEYMSVCQEAEKTRQPLFVEGRIQRSNGEWRWIRSTALPRFAFNGQYLGYTGSTIDITDEKRAEIELRRTNEVLEERVTARTRELEDANRQLMTEIAERERAEAQLLQVQKMEAMGQLTGGVAHDFNNLLTVVLGNAEMLERIVDFAGDQRLKRLLNGIRHAAEQGAQLTRQLLAFARRQPLRPEPIRLQERLQGMSQLIERSLQPDIKVIWDFSKDLWPVLVDPTQLELAVLNIAVNARDAMPKGGAIRIAAENCIIGVRDSSDISPGSYVRLAIIDTGEGIPPEILARVFEPFFTTKDKGKGSGLGLSQVYGFARQSGGTVHITSESGLGTTVALLLPRAQSEPVRPPVPEVVSAHTEQGTILVVEDDNAVAEIVGEMLTTLGYRMTRAHSASEALNILDAGLTFDLVFSDVLMPGTMTGIGLAGEIRHRYPYLPVLLTTGYSEAINDAVADGFHVLPKPYRAATLMKAIRSCMESHVQQAEMVIAE